MNLWRVSIYAALKRNELKKSLKFICNYKLKLFIFAAAFTKEWELKKPKKFWSVDLVLKGKTNRKKSLKIFSDLIWN